MKQRLTNAPELLDEVSHDDAELAHSLRHVAEVNRWLGGTRAVLNALSPLIPPGGARILDIGTGSADIPLAIARWARAHNRFVTIHATDVHPQMRTLAELYTQHESAITIGAADARALPFSRHDGFDIVLLSLTLHHFEQQDQVTVLREAARVARRAVIVNELERNRINYWGARLLAATRWRNNRLTRHDGPRSVLRAFTRDELAALAHQAGLRIERLQRRPFYRLVLVAYTAAQ